MYIVYTYISVFFFPREPWKCPWTPLFQNFSRAHFCVHGHILDKIHGQEDAFTGIFLDFFTGTFTWFTGTFLWFTATFEVHGHLFSCSRVLFQCSRPHFCHLFTGKKKYSRAFFSKCSLAHFQGSRGKKNTATHLQLHTTHFGLHTTHYTHNFVCSE